MVQIQLRYEGTLRCAAVHGPSNVRLLTDAPVDNCGRGESFSPTDLVATALVTCKVTLMAIVADKHGWELRDVGATVDKHMVADPQRRIGRLDVRIRIPGDWSEEQRTVLEEAARTCPVRLSISERIEVPLRFEWGAPAPSARNA